MKFSRRSLFKLAGGLGLGALVGAPKMEPDATDAVQTFLPDDATVISTNWAGTDVWEITGMGFSPSGVIVLVGSGGGVEWARGR